MNGLTALIALILEIVERHGPTPITKTELETAVLAEITSGRHQEIAWFVSKGLEPPQD
jgi:hypothetical protein